MKINIKEIVNEIQNDETLETETVEAEAEVEMQPEPENEVENKLENEVEDEENVEQESKAEEPEVEETVEAEFAESEVEAEKVETEEVETEEVEVDEADEVTDADVSQEEKVSFFKKFRDLFAIGLAFILLVAATFYYTEMIPRSIVATVDGETKNYTTTAWTVEEFFESEKISYCEEDFVSMPVGGFIHDGLEVELIHAYDYKITVDGQTLDYKTLKKTVGEALEEEGVVLSKLDIVKPGLKKPVKNGMTIVVKRVVVKEKTVEEVLKYKTIKKKDPSMNEGKTKVVREGKNGKAKVTYRITYVDGKETKRKKIKSVTIEPKKNKIVKVGTRVTIDGFAYSRKLVVKAYSYTGGGTTAMGTRARVGEIAVDPSVIPLGSRVYIEGFGVRYAEDTGGNIKGNTIDIYMNTMAECRNWGVRYVTIYIE